MTIADYHEFLLFIINKEQTAWHSPHEIDICIHRSQMDLYNKYAPIYGTDEIAKKALDPFVVPFQVTPANSGGGIVSLPSNFGQLLSADAISFSNTTGVIYFPIDIVNNDEFALRAMSQLMPVTTSKPILKSIGNGVYQLFPQVPNTAVFTYLSVPVQPVYSFTATGRVSTYLPGASTQLQWNDSFASPIIKKALVYLGVNIEDQLLISLMSEKQIAA